MGIKEESAEIWSLRVNELNCRVLSDILRGNRADESFDGFIANPDRFF